MISGVKVDVGGSTETLRMTTNAMMAAEDHFDAGIVNIVQELNGDFRVGTVVQLLAFCGNDGKGMDLDRAKEVVDEIGLAKAGELLGKVAEAAFPEAKSQEKNVKGAVRSK